MDTVVRYFMELIKQAYHNQYGRGDVPDEELERFIDLLEQVDWDNSPRQLPPVPKSVPGLRHLPPAVAGVADKPVADTLRACVGFVPWDTFYTRTDWSEPFLDDFTCGELVGPAGYIANDSVSVGLFLLGPNVSYSEHAHDAVEVYYVLSGEAEWMVDRPDQIRHAKAGDAVLISRHQRHAIRTGDTPLLVAYTWRDRPNAGSYYRTEGPWGEGDYVTPVLVTH